MSPMPHLPLPLILLALRWSLPIEEVNAHNSIDEWVLGPHRHSHYPVAFSERQLVTHEKWETPTDEEQEKSKEVCVLFLDSLDSAYTWNWSYEVKSVTAY